MRAEDWLAIAIVVAVYGLLIWKGSEITARLLWPSQVCQVCDRFHPEETHSDDRGDR